MVSLNGEITIAFPYGVGDRFALCVVFCIQLTDLWDVVQQFFDVVIWNQVVRRIKFTVTRI